MKCSCGISNFLEEIFSHSHSISLHWLLRKAFLSLLAVLWNSAFRWIYLSFKSLIIRKLKVLLEFKNVYWNWRICVRLKHSTEYQAQWLKWDTCSVCSVAQSCLTSCDCKDCSLPVSSVLGIFPVRILEWVAISFLRGSSWPRDGTHVSCIVKWIFYHWASWKAQENDICNMTIVMKP